MNLLEQIYTDILKESEEIYWNTPIRWQGSPTKVPIVGEYNSTKYSVDISLDKNGEGDTTPYDHRLAVVKSDYWRKPLIWIHVKIGLKYDVYKSKYIFNFVLDTPENRIKVEKRFKEIIYALMKTTNHRPKMIYQYIKSVVEKPL